MAKCWIYYTVFMCVALMVFNKSLTSLSNCDLIFLHFWWGLPDCLSLCCERSEYPELMTLNLPFTQSHLWFYGLLSNFEDLIFIRWAFSKSSQESRNCYYSKFIDDADGLLTNLLIFILVITWRIAVSDRLLFPPAGTILRIDTLLLIDDWLMMKSCCFC